MPSPEEFHDDKSPHVIPFILSLLSTHQQAHPNPSQTPPFFIGLNGVQGAGKTVLVSSLKRTLSSPPHNLPTVVFSLDDFYLTHNDQLALAKANPDNPLLQHRGQPGTHDIPLALEVFKDLKEGKRTSIPAYDKACFEGQGDRLPMSEWEVVNEDLSKPIKVVLFEGWCVGFRPLSSTALREKWQDAHDAASTQGDGYKGRLGRNSLQSVATINRALHAYDRLTDQFDAFVHIDAEDPLFVYKWRLEQEHGLWEKKRSGMSDEMVKEFVDGYYPAYELYTETLRNGVFSGQGEKGRGRQMRLVVGADRKVIEVVKI